MEGFGGLAQMWESAEGGFDGGWGGEGLAAASQAKGAEAFGKGGGKDMGKSFGPNGCGKGDGKKGGGKDGWKGCGKGDGKGGWMDDSWGKGCGKGFDGGWGKGNGWMGDGWDWGKGWGKDDGMGKGGKWGGGPPAWKGDGKGMGKKGGKGKDDGKGIGKAGHKIMMGEPAYCGTLRCFYTEKNCGYIACDDVWNQVGSEVYAFHKVLEGAGVGVGDLIIFFLHWSNRGQPQASSPILRLSAANGFALKGTFKAQESGYGFVQCAATKEIFGRDVYVHKTQAEGFTTGQTVRFNASVKGDWMPIASELEPCEEAWEPMPGDLSVTSEAQSAYGGPSGKGGGKDFGKGFDSWGKGGGKGFDSWGGKGFDPEGGMKRKRPATTTGEIMSGTLKSFNERNNWGFIDCEEARNKWGKDVWIVGHNLVEPAHRVPGAWLQFEVALNEKGQPQAINVNATSSISGVAPPQPQATDGPSQTMPPPPPPASGGGATEGKVVLPPGGAAQVGQVVHPPAGVAEFDAKRQRVENLGDDMTAAINALGLDATSFLG